jgi:hypothetical protein
MNKTIRAFLGALAILRGAKGRGGTRLELRSSRLEKS